MALISSHDSNGRFSGWRRSGFATPRRARVTVDQLPGDRSVEYLPQSLRRLEPMPLRQCPAPRADLVRTQVDEPHLAERESRLREQPAQLFVRRRRCLMHIQVLLHQLGERYLPAATKPVERTPKRPLRLGTRREPTPPTCGRFERRPLTR
jgi:hypothetical protein